MAFTIRNHHPAFIQSLRIPSSFSFVNSTRVSNVCCRRRYVLTNTTTDSIAEGTIPIASASSPSSTSKNNTLVIVESPAKATTIQKILSDEQYQVTSCIGHIREIPSSAKRIPAKFKSLPWARLGVDVENDFRPIYVLISGKQQVVRQLKDLLSQSNELILATDDDREGEAISWHLSEVLKPTIPVRRAVFQEITPDAILNAFQNTRDININLVQAQETRRVLDRLAGYTMSPLLWRKIAGGLSAGRVQSVALALIVKREVQRLLFRRAGYAGCVAELIVGEGDSKTLMQATLTAIDGKRLVRGSDFEDDTGELTPAAAESGMWRFDNTTMQELLQSLRGDEAKVRAVEKRTTTRNPPAPLITSTLQQECGNKLGMGAGKTMSIAQRLYERGYITYMRTDNPTLGEQAVKSCHEEIKRLYGEQFVWDGQGPGRESKRPKRAQAAHEAIRPAGQTFVPPQDIKDITDEEKAVYTIIFRRTLASQMVSAKIDQTAIRIAVPLTEGACGEVAEFKANGNVIVEPGFLSVHHDDSGSSSVYLPHVTEGEPMKIDKADVTQHETKPPPRFNDASLVKILEEQGVGRPSTYAGIIEKLILRGYVYRGRTLHEDKKVPARALVPSLTAFAVEKLLSRHFPSFVDPQFTANLEVALDEIAAGSANRTRYLEDYYCGPNGLAESVKKTETEIDPKYFRRILVPNMPDDMLVHADDQDIVRTQRQGKGKTKLGKRPKAKTTKEKTDDSSDEIEWWNTKILVSSYGPYVEQDGKVVASLPKSTLAEELSADKLRTILQLSQDPELGVDPNSGLPILMKTSRYGPYVQLGYDDSVPEGSKPKRCSLLPGMDVDTITVDEALKLLSLPRLLGSHPKTGHEIRAALGPYGPYVAHDGSYVSLNNKDRHHILEIELNEAVELIDAAEERKRLRREKQAQKKAEKLEESKTEAKSTTKRPSKRQPKTKSKKTVTSQS